MQWEKRYAVLTPEFLTLFKSEKSKSVKQRIFIAHVLHATPADPIRFGGKTKDAPPAYAIGARFSCFGSFCAAGEEKGGLWVEGIERWSGWTRRLPLW